MWREAAPLSSRELLSKSSPKQTLSCNKVANFSKTSQVEKEHGQGTWKGRGCRQSLRSTRLWSTGSRLQGQEHPLEGVGPALWVTWSGFSDLSSSNTFFQWRNLMQDSKIYTSSWRAAQLVRAPVPHALLLSLTALELGPGAWCEKQSTN